MSHIQKIHLYKRLLWVLSACACLGQVQASKPATTLNRALDEMHITGVPRELLVIKQQQEKFRVLYACKGRSMSESFFVQVGLLAAASITVIAMLVFYLLSLGKAIACLTICSILLIVALGFVKYAFKKLVEAYQSITVYLWTDKGFCMVKNKTVTFIPAAQIKYTNCLPADKKGRKMLRIIQRNGFEINVLDLKETDFASQKAFQRFCKATQGHTPL